MGEGGEGLFEKGALLELIEDLRYWKLEVKGPMQTPLLWVLCRMDLSFKSSIDQFSFSTSLRYTFFC